MEEKRIQREKESKESRINQQSPSMDITSIGSGRDSSRPNHSNISFPSNDNSNYAYNVNNSAPKAVAEVSYRSAPTSARKGGSQQNSGLALGPDIATEKELKRRKQLEYRQQLDMLAAAAQANKAKETINSRQPPSPQVVLGDNRNDVPPNNRYIPNQYDHSIPPQQSEHHVNKQYSAQNQYAYDQLSRAPPPSNPRNDGGRNDRRAKQEEYKRELDRQMNEKLSNAQKERDLAEASRLRDAKNIPSNGRETDRQILPNGRDPSHERDDPYRYDNRNNQRAPQSQYEDAARISNAYQGRDERRPYDDPYDHSSNRLPAELPDNPSQEELDNDPNFQAYLRRKAAESSSRRYEEPPYQREELIDRPRDPPLSVSHGET